MRLHYITALLLVGPFALSVGGQGLAAQDTTQSQKPSADTTNQQYSQQNPQANTMQSDTAQLTDEQVVMKMHRINQMEIRAGKLAQSRGSSAKVKSFGQRLVRDHTSSDQKVVALAKQLNITLTRDGMDSAGQERSRDQRRGRWNERDSTRTGMDTRSGMDSTQRNDSTYSSYPRSYGQDSTQGQYGQGRYGEQGQDSTHGDREAMRHLGTLRGAAFDAAFAQAMVDGHNKAISLFERAQNQVQRQEVRTLIASTLPTLRQHLQTAQGLTTSATTTSSR